MQIYLQIICELAVDPTSYGRVFALEWTSKNLECLMDYAQYRGDGVSEVCAMRAHIAGASINHRADGRATGH